VGDATKVTELSEAWTRLFQVAAEFHAGQGRPDVSEAIDAVSLAVSNDNARREADYDALAAQRDALVAALESIAASPNCGCHPCRGQCRSQPALEIELDSIRALARETLAAARPQ
jgi:hypothetical protein